MTYTVHSMCCVYYDHYLLILHVLQCNILRRGHRMMLAAICTDLKFFWTNNFFGQKFLSDMNYFLTQNVFGSKIFVNQILFWPKIFYDPKFFLPKIFFNPFFFYPKFLKPKFFSTQIFSD